MEGRPAPQRSQVSPADHHRIELVALGIEQHALGDGADNEIRVITDVDGFFHNQTIPFRHLF